MDKVGGFNCKVTLLEPYKIALLKAFFFGIFIHLSNIFIHQRMHKWLS